MSLLQGAFLIDAIISGGLGITMLAATNQVIPWIFGNDARVSGDVQKMIGAMWLACGVCLLLGTMFPVTMAAVLIMQWIYKTIWLFCVALPRTLHEPLFAIQSRLTWLFGLYVISFPWVIPWKKVFEATAVQDGEDGTSISTHELAAVISLVADASRVLTGTGTSSSGH